MTFRWIRTKLMVAVAAAVALSACANEPRVVDPGEPIRSGLPRDMDPDVSPAAQAELVAGMNAFAFDLHHLVAEDKAGENAFTSPFSIATALAMTYAGARGETETQMAEALHYTLPQEELHPAFDWLDLELQSRGEGAAGTDGQPFQLSVANRLWSRLGREFVPEYLDLVAVNYGAGLYALDFVGDPEGSREAINTWIEDQTAGRIEDLLPEGAINGDTALVLTNAIYFNAAWEVQFDPDSTADGPFDLLDGGTATAPLMHLANEFSYANVDGVQAVEMPYDGHELSMVVLLPPAGAGSFESFEASLDAEALSAILSSMYTYEVYLTLPRFTFTTEVSLKEALSALGMPVAFTDEADFTGMDPEGTMRISEVFHKAFVAVDETGTEAAAATAVVMEDTAVPETVDMTVDRPFLFVIRDNATGAILFVGRVVNPAA